MPKHTYATNTYMVSSMIGYISNRNKQDSWGKPSISTE